MGPARASLLVLLAACAALSAAVVARPASAAEQAAPTLREGMPYAAARGALIAKGFRPVASGSRDDSRCPAARQDVCGAYPETVSCSSTGAAACRFIFEAPKGANLTVVADGPDLAHLKVVTSRRSARADVAWQQRPAR